MFLLVFSGDSLIVYMKKKVMIPKYSSDSWLALFFTAYTDKSPFLLSAICLETPKIFYGQNCDRFLVFQPCGWLAIKR